MVTRGRVEGEGDEMVTGDETVTRGREGDEMVTRGK